MRRRKNFLASLIFWILPLAVLSYGCRRSSSKLMLPVTFQAVSVAGQVLLMPVDSLDPAYRGVNMKSVRRFYRERNNSLAWSVNNQLNQAGDSIVLFIKNIRYYGLLPSAYHFKEIEAIEQRLRREGDAVRLDALLTDAFISIVGDFQHGRSKVPNRQRDSVALLALQEVMQRRKGLVESFHLAEPQFEAYHALKSALKFTLDSLNYYSDRIGLLENSDGVVTVLKKRIQSLGINMERWRREGDSWGDRYVYINIPSFMLYVVSNNVAVLESRVIVGKPETATPELTSSIDCFVTYPYWQVPRKIATEEYLPFIKKDVSFISRNYFDVLDTKGNILNADSVPWETFTVKYFPVSLRQREGMDNSLGIVKFIFDNPYSVFLHDTNARQLFGSRVRAFSHGCIRMEKAIELSHYLVTGDASKRSKVLDKYLKEKLRHTIDLSVPIPIYVRYRTCDFNRGRITFYNDIYKKDHTLIDLLYAGDHINEF